MPPTHLAELALLIFAAALLYSSIGHGGGSGYIAAMALLGVAPAVMKPAALSLNILVATIGTVKFYRAGHFSWAVFWPFAVTSVPLAFIGGFITLPGSAYKGIVGLVLLYSAYRLFLLTRTSTPQPIQRPPLWAAMLAGSGIGLLSGLTGVGGGIFLSPFLLLMGWAEAKETAAVSAAFILVNSISGLSGYLSKGAVLPDYIFLLAASAIIGGWIGAGYGSRRLAGTTIRRLLAAVLVIAGLKMIFA